MVRACSNSDALWGIRWRESDAARHVVVDVAYEVVADDHTIVGTDVDPGGSIGAGAGGKHAADVVAIDERPAAPNIDTENRWPKRCGVSIRRYVGDRIAGDRVT